MSKHILIVEDSPDLQLLLSHLLKSEGYDLSQAENGLEALKLLKGMSQLPALILLDVMMPVMGGIEFCKAQKADMRLSHIPIVVMTADPNSQTAVEKLGVKAFIRKPIIDIEGLLDTVEEITKDN